MKSPLAVGSVRSAGLARGNDGPPANGAALRKMIDRVLRDVAGGGQVAATGPLGSFYLKGAEIPGRAPLHEIRFNASIGSISLWDSSVHETMVWLQNHTSRSGSIDVRGAVAALLRGANERYPAVGALDRSLVDAARGFPGLSVTRDMSGGIATSYLRRVDRDERARSYGFQLDPSRWTIEYWPTDSVHDVSRVPIEGGNVLGAVHRAAREIAHRPIP